MKALNAPDVAGSRRRSRLKVGLVAVLVTVLLVTLGGAVLLARGRKTTQATAQPGPPDHTFTLSAREHALPQGGISDAGTDPDTVPHALVMRVAPGVYDVTLESDLSVCRRNTDAVLDQAFLVVWRPLDPKGWYWVLTEGEVTHIEVPTSSAPPCAFIVDEATADNLGEATISFYRVR